METLANNRGLRHAKVMYVGREHSFNHWSDCALLWMPDGDFDYLIGELNEDASDFAEQMQNQITNKDSEKRRVRRSVEKSLPNFSRTISWIFLTSTLECRVMCVCVCSCRLMLRSAHVLRGLPNELYNGMNFRCGKSDAKRILSWDIKS